MRRRPHTGSLYLRLNFICYAPLLGLCTCQFLICQLLAACSLRFWINSKRYKTLRPHFNEMGMSEFPFFHGQLHSLHSLRIDGRVFDVDGHLQQLLQVVIIITLWEFVCSARKTRGLHIHMWRHSVERLRLSAALKKSLGELTV